MNRNELIRTGIIGLALVAGVGVGCKGNTGSGGATASTGAGAATSTATGSTTTTVAGSTSTGKSTATTGSTASATGSTTTASATSSTTASTTATTGSTTATSSTGSSGCTNLTVKNYLGWCSVSVNGATATAATAQTVCLPDGNIDVSATPASTTFALGANMWHHTSMDSGSGEAGMVSGMTSTAVAVVANNTSKCVWVCCPFVGGSGCPTTDQCP